MINIVCKGIWPIPDEARDCPVCGERKEIYQFTLESKKYVNSLQNVYSVNDMDFIQKYPTFTCKECQTIWQYLGEKEERKENE